MKHPAVATMLLALAALFALGCTKDKKDKGPSTLPKEKLSRVYKTSHTVTERYMAMLDTWTTLSESTNDRQLLFEFVWEGDRLMSMNSDELSFTFNYDDAGRVEKVSSNRKSAFNYEFTYGDDGLMSHSYAYSYDDNGDIDVRKHVFYTWEDGKLQKSEDVMQNRLDGGRRVSTAVHELTWDGDNVTSTVRTTKDESDGSTSVTRYSYEYSDIDNPTQGFVLFQEPAMGLYWEFEGIEGLSGKILSKVTGDNVEYSFEHTTTNGRISSIKMIQVASTVTPVMTLRVTSERFLEFEYAE